MKKTLVILGGLLFGVFMLGIGQVIAQESINLNLSQSIDLALANNLELKKASYQLGNAEIDAKKSEAGNWLTQSNLIERERELLLLQEKDQYQQQKDELLIQVVDEYFQLKSAQKDIQLKEKELGLEKNILGEVTAQVNAGYKVDLDLLQQGNKYYDALFSYENTKQNYQQYLMDFCMTLGFDANRKFELATINIPDFKEISLEQALQKGRENSVELQAKTLETELARLELEKTKVSDSSKLDLNELENNLAMAQLDSLIANQDLTYQIQTQWQGYEQKKKDIGLSQQNLKQMEENKAIITRQVKAGLRSEDEQLSANIGVLEAEYRLISSIRDYYASLLKLESIMGDLNKGEIQ